MHLSLQNKDLLNKINSIHFIGISGISMKGLALFMASHYPHIQISGTTNVADYHIKGISININTDHLSVQTTMVVYTSCLEYQHQALLDNFKHQGYLCLHRSELLNLITKNHLPKADLMKRILVTGAHGKTSTTYFTYQLLKEKGYGCFIGADLKETGNSYIDGQVGYVIEGDESDSSYKNITPVDYLLINNISTDHLENYQDSFEEYLYSFEKYLFHHNGIVIYNKNKYKQFETPVSLEESSNSYVLDKLIERTKVKHISYGVENSHVNIDIIEYVDRLQWKLSTTLPDLITLNNRIFTVENFFGQWNIYNITAGLIVATLENIKLPAQLLLERPQRRMEIIVDKKIGNKIIYDDYAVHPTEIYNVIQFCKKKYKIAEVAFIWEPHRPSRIRRLASNFYEVFSDIEENLFVMPIYNASETNLLNEEELKRYMDYQNIDYQNIDLEITQLLKNPKYKTIVLLSAGPLSKKIRGMIGQNH